MQMSITPIGVAHTPVTGAASAIMARPGGVLSYKRIGADCIGEGLV
jgi:hypothetical protein